MKRPFLLFACMSILLTASAQLKTTANCPPFTVNLLEGKINELLLPTVPWGYVKEKFPCFTSADPEAATSKCGGGVYYKDRDIYFYTARDYVEIGPNFKGKLSIPLMGANRTGLFKWLGNPQIKDVNWDAFTTRYGTLVTYYNKAGKVNKIQFSTLGVDGLTLCE